MKSASIRVLVADGDPLVSRALVRLLRNSVDVEVIATAKSEDEVLKLADQLHPAVALVDARTARLDGMKDKQSLSKQSLCEQIPATRVIILSVYEALRDEALSTGACRFLLKDGGRDALVAAIRLAANGQCESDLGDMGENDSSGG